jgi:hypothetical protein
MKRILFSLFSLLCIASSYAISLNGREYTIDTLAHYQVGPGTWYLQLRMTLQSSGLGRRDVYILQVDRRNPYVSVQTVLSNDSVANGERTSSMAKRKSKSGKRYFAGTNGDWWSTSRPGVPVGAFVADNTIAITPNEGRATYAMCAIDQNDSLYFGHDFFTDVYLQTDNDTVRCTHVNDTQYDNELVLYNTFNGHYTHTDASATEVLCRILPESAWGTNTTMAAEVVRLECNKGNMHIEDGCFVLSATGDKQTYLTRLAVGQKITLKISTSINNVFANFKAALGGQNRTFMLVNGVVDNNWDENHPRTGLGYSMTGDTIIHCVVDGRGKSMGATTGVLAEIMRHYGAYNAMNMEGGGSSTMYLMHTGVMNAVADGSERAESQGIFAVSSAPDDDVIARIAPMHPVVRLPKYGVLVPTFLGYNQYDMLLNMDVPNVQLSCDPTVGYFDDLGRFVCLQSGLLYASLGDIQTTIEIRLIDSAPVDIRLDSVLCGAGKPYKIEVQGIVGDTPIDLLSDALDWESLDSNIADVEPTGEIIPVSNGVTQIVGRLGDFEDTIVVTVEIPEANKIVWDDFRNTASWEVKGSPTSFKPSLSVPEDPNAPVNLIFTYGSGRNPFIQLSKDSLLYSKPEKILVPITTNAVFEKVIVMIRANNSNTTEQITFLNPKAGEENILEIDVKERFGADVAIYPLHFLSLKMVPTSETTKGECYVTLPGIIEVFAEETTDIEDIITSNTHSPSKFIENGALYIHSEGKVYDVLGAQVNK